MAHHESDPRPAGKGRGATRVTPPSVAIVSLGRSAAKGEVRRAASWCTIFERAGAQAAAVPLTLRRVPHLTGFGAVARGHAAPETLAWSTGALLDRLEALGPDLVVVVSTRAFDARVTEGRWTTVLDFVDSLAGSYADRAALHRGLHRAGFAALARCHSRVERHLAGGGLRTVAAGWEDARRLGAAWVPIVVEPGLVQPRTPGPDRDVLFFGTLRYPPNVDALERLAALWPRVLAARPGTSALVAGADPLPRVLELCRRQGWELVADFPSLPAVAARARIAVAPLSRTAGIQIKVLDAAALELPQVVTTPALAGLAPGFPIHPVDDDAAFAGEVVRLLADPVAARASAASARGHVQSEYGVERWASWARDLLGSP